MSMKRLTPTLLLIGYGIGSVALLLFSYTQVDLNLTLSRASWLQHVQKAFQSVGYYHRVEATLLYGIILVLFFSLYGISIRLARAGRLSGSDVWRMIGVVTTVLVFSYPAAFSYDFFNYLFTAKTVLVYHQNPYVVAPLLFSGIDPWTNFMRWTHLTSAYTPLWIGLSCIPFVFGFGMFLPTVIATKIFIALFYLLTAYGISVVAGRSRNQSSPVALVVFALQPLVIVESLVSSHNDVVLTACMMVSLIYYQSKNYWHAWFWWAVSVAAKVRTTLAGARNHPAPRHALASASEMADRLGRGP